MVLGIIRLCIVTLLFCPILWILAVVWWYWAGVQGASSMSMLLAAVRVCPCAAAVMLMMMFMQFVLFMNSCFAVSVFWGVCPPIIIGELSSAARVCTMSRWWAAMTILCPWSFAFWTHSMAWGSLAVAVIFLSAVSWMRVS